MSDPLSPIRRIEADRRAGRRATDPLLVEDHAQEAPTVANLPAPISPAPEQPGTAAFEAQRLGQEGQKRGLRGGKPVLEHARHAYLGAEWSGEADRRPPRGLLTKTTI